MNVEGSTPPLEPPNGHDYSGTELYRALWQLDQRLADRDTAFMDQIGQLRTDFSNHTKDGHPYTERAEVVKQEIALDAKKVGLVTALVGVFSAALALLRGKLGL